MDILSHFLWTFGIFFKHEKIWILGIIGAMPDILSTGPYFIYLSAATIFKFSKPNTIPRHVYLLYNLTHSLFIFIIIFGLVYTFFSKYAIFLLPWLIHILMDIPSHSKNRPSKYFLWPLRVKGSFPTRILWPISNFCFDGINWTTKRFMILNYSLLSLVLLLRFLKIL